MPVERQLLDTNTVVRFLVGDPPAQAQGSRIVFARADRGEIELVMLPLVVAEVFFTLESFYKVNRAVVASLLLKLLSASGIEASEKPVVMAALSRCEKQKAHFVDACIAAVALEQKLRVVSFDRDFDRFAGVVRIEPG